MSENCKDNFPGLYIHIPFCKTKCPYCDFYSVTSPELISAYLSALEKEALIYSGTNFPPIPAQAKIPPAPLCQRGVQSPPLEKGDLGGFAVALAEACDYHAPAFPTFDSLYLGGGTPSLLTEAQIASLMKNLRGHFVFAPDSEITLEANPDDLTPEKLRLWRDLGINRLSLGAQSFDEAELRFLGRRHSAAQTVQAIGLARAAGFANLGLDLMYALPGQTAAAWLKTLETALSLAPEHLSCYQLTILAGETPALRTPLARLAARGELTLPDEEAQGELFLLTGEFLKERGYLHYEVANFARGEAYRCRHNLKYWTHIPYLGLGPAAHSFRDGRRWWNCASVAEYCSRLDAGRAPLAGSETLSPEELRLEALALGFRTQAGVSLETIREHPGWEAILNRLQAAGLIRVCRGRVQPTPRGLAVADGLPLWFAG